MLLALSVNMLVIAGSLIVVIQITKLIIEVCSSNLKNQASPKSELAMDKIFQLKVRAWLPLKEIQVQN